MGIFPTIENKELLLSKTYQLAVDVEIDEDHYAGILILSPEEITLRIMGDEKEGRKMLFQHHEWHNNLICSHMLSQISLQNLKLISNFSIPVGVKSIFSSYSESTFNVSSILFYPFNPSSIDNKFCGLNIYSQTINDWIGETNTQNALLNKYYEGNVFIESPELLREFNFEINNLGNIGVYYKIYPQQGSLKSGIQINPYLFLKFNSEKTENEITEKFFEIYNLLALIIGNDFILDKIEFVCEGFNLSGISSQFPTFYYPSITKEIAKKISQKAMPSSYHLFPLGKDLKHDAWGLRELPLEIFSNYFTLSSSEINHYAKYVKYRRMENVEERFLGYFRILESLCAKKKTYLDAQLLKSLSNRIKPYLIKKFQDKKSVCSFLNGLPRLNESKYNTAKCIQDFFEETIEKSISHDWKFSKKDINEICNLRNDITHANGHNNTENEILEKTKFVEILLIIALFKKVGIILDRLIIFRIDNYNLIAKHPN